MLPSQRKRFRFLVPAGERQRLAPEGKQAGQRAVGVHHERAAVEDELVLSADLVDVRERHARLGRAHPRELETMRELLDLEGRSVGDEQQLRAALRQVGGDRVEPDVFADRKAQADVPERHRLRQRAGLEDALLIEDAVVRQLVLEAQLSASVCDQRHGVVQMSLLLPWKGHHDTGHAGGRAFTLQFAERMGDCVEQCGT